MTTHRNAPPPRRRRFLGAVIVAVWLVAVGLLLHREFGGDLFRGDAAGRLPTAAGSGSGEGPETVAYAVRLAGPPTRQAPARPAAEPQEDQVGAVRMVREAEVRHGFDGQAARVEARMALRLLGKQTSLRVDGDLWRPDDPVAAGQEAEMDFRIHSQGHDFRLVATLAGGRLTGEVRSAGETLPLDLPVGDDVLVESGLGATLRFPAMEVGETLRFASFDPLTLSRGRAKVTCVAEETLWIAGEAVATKRLEVEASGLDTVAWIDDAGEVVRAETPLGLVLERLPADASLDQGLDQALDQTLRPATDADDFLGRTAVVPSGLTPRRGAERLVLRLTGGDLEPPTDVAQRRLDDDARPESGTVLEIVRLDPSAAPARPRDDEPPAPRHLAADPFVQSDHPDIRERALAIVGDETGPWRRALRLHDWVFERLDKEPVVSIPSALEVLRQRRGDCNEHAVLYAALARSLGLPTRIAIGLVWSDELGGFYYHAWPEVHLAAADELSGGTASPAARAGWVRVDPTLGQPVADATHVKLLEGGIETWPRLLAYLGKLEIEVLEMEPNTEMETEMEPNTETAPE